MEEAAEGTLAEMCQLRELRTVDGKVTGAVLTMVNESKASKYAYDGYSYYRGKYRDYYEAG